VGEGQVDGVSGRAGDVFERGQRRARAPGLDQVDGQGRDTPFTQLGEAQAGLEPSLLDRTRPQVYARKSASLRLRVSRNWCVCPPAGHGRSLYTKTLSAAGINS